MRRFFKTHPITWNTHLPVLIGLLLAAALWLLPTGYEEALIYQGAEHCRGEVIAVDNSAIVNHGLIQSGEQRCEIVLLDGAFQGQVVTGINMLTGSLESDKVFQAGDTALVIVSHNEQQMTSVNLIDHYRLDKALLLALLFAVFLILFAGAAGVRAILSFLLTILFLWKLLVPAYLNGVQPVWMGLMITLLLTVMIIVLVYGFDRRAVAAVSGSFLGIMTTALLGILFSDAFLIHGAIMPYSESLLYSGYLDLNLTQIFMASIFIGASGAMMDLAVDITSAVQEVVQKKPAITWQEAAHSGLQVGKAAMGTMTTMLLLAYSGGYIALLMVFMAQGTPLDNILNYRYIAAEILDTIAGSFGLVTVAPFTALTSGYLLTKGKK